MPTIEDLIEDTINHLMDQDAPLEAILEACQDSEVYKYEPTKQTRKAK